MKYSFKFSHKDEVVGADPISKGEGRWEKKSMQR